MSGSEQFLGRQLNKQAEALGELVVKMGQMVTAQEQSISTFTIASDEIRQSKVFSPAQNIYTTTNPLNIVSFINGNVRLKYSIPKAGSSLQLKINGVVSVVRGSGSINGLNVFDVSTKEGDTIELSATSDTGLTVTKIDVCYDLISKPAMGI